MIMSSILSATDPSDPTFIRYTTNDINMSKRSLASDYVVCIQDDGTFSTHSTLKIMTWSLFPIDVHTHERTIPTNGIGQQDIEALQNHDLGTEGKLDITVRVEPHEDTPDWTLVQVQTTNTGNDNKKQELQMIISKIMIQYILQRTYSHFDVSSKVQIGEDEIYLISDLIAPQGHASFFASLLTDVIDDINTVEMSDMVDGNGIPLGALPRPLLHKYNILHRGIGIVVCDKEHLHRNSSLVQEEHCLIYCHRRASTKRIFPSLYDMFVGGVSTAGEDSQLTAEREVGEELGLTRSSLSDELFKCLICTSYNRCMVSMFTYRYDGREGDNIKWQEEEVDWGDFVPYNLIKQVASYSVERLIQKKEWPGNKDDLMFLKATLNETKESDDTVEWDFVPDGLLVWVAWLKWMNGIEK
jgi:isopentenyldiphosphate isomerase